MPTPSDSLRAALLASARVSFTEHGYDHATVREITGRVDGNPSLVNRLFGSKQALFAEAVADSFTIGDLLVGERATLGDRLARWLVTPRPAGGFDPTLVLLRSAASPDAAPQLRAALEAQVVAPLARWLGGAHADARAGLVLSVLFGIAVTRDVMALPTLDRADGDVLSAYLGPMLQRILDGAPVTDPATPDDG